LDVKSSELLRKLKKVANSRGETLVITPAKGSHQKLYWGKDKQTVVPLHNKELKTGTLKSILKDLGINEKELYEN